MPLASTPEPPNHVLVITVERTEDDDGCTETAEDMYRLAARQPGFLATESVCDAGQRLGITSSSWIDAEAMTAWKRQADDFKAKWLGPERWYRAHSVRIARVERDERWSEPEDSPS